MIFKQRVKTLLKPFSSVYISVDSPEQDIIVFNIPVIIAKKNQINAQGLKNSSCIIENLLTANGATVGTAKESIRQQHTEEKASEYDQEMEQSNNSDQHTAQQGRDTKHRQPHDRNNAIKVH